MSCYDRERPREQSSSARSDAEQHFLRPPLTLVSWLPRYLISLTFFWTNVQTVPARDKTCVVSRTISTNSPQFELMRSTRVDWHCQSVLDWHCQFINLSRFLRTGGGNPALRQFLTLLSTLFAARCLPSLDSESCGPLWIHVFVEHVVSYLVTSVWEGLLPLHAMVVPRCPLGVAQRVQRLPVCLTAHVWLSLRTVSGLGCRFKRISNPSTRKTRGASIQVWEGPRPDPSLPTVGHRLGNDVAHKVQPSR